MFTLATLLVLAGTFGLGLVLVEAARARAPTPGGAIERAGLALLVGLGSTAVLATALIAGLGPPAPFATRAALLAAALAGAGAWIRGARARRARAKSRSDAAAEGCECPPWTTLDRVLALALVGFTGFAVFYAASMPMHLFDPVYHFAYKGKLLAHEGFGGPSWTDLEGPIGRIITHPDYPPGLPALHAVVAAAGRQFDEDATRALMGAFAAAAIAVLFAALRPRGRRPALIGALALAGLPLLYYSQLPRNPVDFDKDELTFVSSLDVQPGEFGRAALALAIGAETAQRRFPHLGPFQLPDGWTLDGAGDFPLAALLLGALVCLTRAAAGARRAAGHDPEWRGEPAGGAGDGVLAGVLLGAAALMKNEGLALGAMALIVFAVRCVIAPGSWVRARALQQSGWALVLFVLAVAPWMVLRRDIPSIDENYPAAVLRMLGIGDAPTAGPFDHSPGSLGAAATRFPVVLMGFVQSSLNPLRWNLVWVLFGAVLAWRLARPRALLHHPLAVPLAVVVGAWALYALVLLVTPWDLAVLYTTAIPDRLLLQIAPVAIWCAVGLAWRRISPEQP